MNSILFKLFFAFVVVCPPVSCLALLPDPGNIYYGVARDVFGLPYPAGSTAKVVMVRVIGTLDDPSDAIADDDIVLAESPIISPSSDAVVNYVLRPSLDDGLTLNRYSPTAGRTGDVVRLFIVDGGLRYSVAASGGCAPVSDPVPSIGSRGSIQQVNIRAIDDLDGDCISDSWELALLGDTGFSQFEDFDGDGFNNLAEFLGGTNPLIADSINLTLENLGMSLLKSGNFLTVEWPRDPARVYVLQWGASTEAFSDIPAARLSGTRNNVVDVTGFTRVFIRLRVSR